MPYARRRRAGRRPARRRVARPAARTRRTYRRNYARVNNRSARPFPVKMLLKMTVAYTFKFEYNQATPSIVPTFWGNQLNNTLRGTGTATGDGLTAIAGREPRYLDTLYGATGTDAPYNKYTVLGSKIRVTATASQNQTGSSTKTCQVFCLPTPEAVANSYSSASELMERPMCRSRTLNGSGNAKNAVTLIQYMPTHTVLGHKDTTDKSGCSAPWGSTPSDRWKWSIGHICHDANEVGSVSYAVRITYYVQFSELNDVDDS